ncbi:DUF695 domain-containing protein [Pokkaliibacter plantistimulans]|uniref:DUF695 domain-containing protein n=1 Tax=Pokkaliibacter plantistimulans TaxID=1635171 RepID=UPI000D750263|nr:DUF695 domain-containing protein [Pokkaliibacter plantistimulans]
MPVPLPYARPAALLALLLSSTLLGGCLLQQNKPQWAMASAKNEQQQTTLVFRYLKGLPPGFATAEQPVKITIDWKYQSANGMPDTATSTRMSEMEKLLEPLVNSWGFATLALVSTGQGDKQWIYYAKSEEGFFSRMNQALAGLPRLPLEIQAEQEPGWDSYKDFISGLHK